MTSWPFSRISSAILLFTTISNLTVAQPANHPLRPLKGAEKQVQMFGGMYKDSDHQREILRKLGDFRSEPSGSRADGGWKSIGPTFSYSEATQDPNVRINTGRAVDIEWTAHAGLRVLSASGGLWVNDCEMPCSTSTGEPIYNWTPISDGLNTLRGGAFCTHPSDGDVIILGTGEPHIGGGTGLYRTTDRGVNWELIDLSPFCKEFYNVIYDPENPVVVHVTGNQGYYRSDNGGTTFTRRMTGVVTDLVVNPQRTATLYAVRQGVGYHRSYDRGDTWQLISTAPNFGLGRSEIDICAVDTSLLVTTATTNAGGYYGHKWIYRTVDAGLTWDSCSVGYPCNGVPPQCYNYYDGQAWYNNALGIAPDDCGVFVGGGVAMIRGENTQDSCWYTQTHFLPESNEHHPDQHDVAWQTVPGSPPICWVANDGGIAYSGPPYKYFAGGEANRIPIFQIYDFSLVDSNMVSYGIATQDNKTILMNPYSGNDWVGVWGGDGFSVSINRVEPQKVFMVNNDNLFFTNDGGLSNSYRPVPGIRERKVRYGGAENDPKVYVSGWDPADGIAEKFLYWSTNEGGTWSPMPGAPLTRPIQTFDVGRGASPTIYASLWVDHPLYSTTNRLMVFDGVDGQWHERSAYLHDQDRVEDVKPDLFDPDIALLYMNNEQSRSDGANVYWTEDRGQTWENITGDLPDARIRAGLIYPYNRNIIILGNYDGGCFITYDKGENWERWNEGMPSANIITKLQFIDSVSTTGKFHVFASSYGRSLWMRDLIASEVSGLAEAVPPGGPEGSAWFNALDELALRVKLDRTEAVTIRLYATDGRLLHTAHIGTLPMGLTETAIAVPHLPFGIYVVEMKSPSGRSTQRVAKY